MEKRKESRELGGREQKNQPHFKKLQNKARIRKVVNETALKAIKVLCGGGARL